MDDTDLRGSSGGGDSSSLNLAFTQIYKVYYRLSRFAYSSTCSLHHPLRRFPASGFACLLFPLLGLFIYICFGSHAWNNCLRLFVDIYWKNEHRLTCTSEICTAAERDRFEKSVSFFSFLTC